MKKNISILLFEKEIFLNSILEEQLSNFSNYQISLVDHNRNLFKIINEFFFDTAIINLDDLEKDDILKFIKVFQEKNNHENLILYHDQLNEYKINNNERNIIVLIKPFKLNTLTTHIIDIVNNKDKNTQKIYLMENLIFLPVKKIIYNTNTNMKDHLTEKETKLLEYLFNNKNYEILKKNILTFIWGIEEDINTHTLETHLYRLRQKLYKLEPKLTFSLINKNGKYFYQINK